MIFSTLLGYPLDPRVYLLDVDQKSVRVSSWVSFFRDYCGQDPTILSAKPDQSVRPTVVALVDTMGDLESGSSIAIAHVGGEERHVFRVVETHPALGPIARGIEIPFRGGVRPVQIDGFRPLIVDEEGRACVSVSPPPRRTVAFGFDPIYSLCQDTREDSDAASAATNANWIPVMLHMFAWAAPFAVWKSFWPADVPPLIYTVDTEAGSGYYDPARGSCTWSIGRRFARNRLDMKTEMSVKKAAERLERHGLVGSFFVDLNAVRDEPDRTALRDVARHHDVSLHLPRIGDHEAWKRTASDSAATQVALKEAVVMLAREIGQPIGFRYPSWYRKPDTHDLVAGVGLGYDSSSLAHPPFLVVPYRMFSSATGEPLDLWEFPCREVIGAVKASSSLWLGWRTRGRHCGEIRRYLRSCADLSSLVVMCDHDMALGASRRHVHGTWRLDARRLRTILQAAGRTTKSGRLRPMRGSDFLRWWTSTRQIRLESRSEPISGGFRLTIAAQESSRDP